MLRGKHLPHFIWLVAWLFFQCGELQAWTLTTIQGHEYVPLSEVQSFYEFGLHTATLDAVRLAKPDKVLLAPFATKDLFLNNLHFYLNLPIVKEAGVPMLSRLDLAKLIDPVLRPDHINAGPVTTVILDAGHGGNDQGTSSIYGTEKVFSLDTINRLAPLLRAQGLNVVFTRTSDVFVSLEDRVLIANQNSDAIFVSVHFNAGASTRGIETYALTPLGVPSSDNKVSLADFQPCPGNAYDPENIALATAIHGCIMGRIHLRDRGVRRARFHVIKGINMPGVLVEGGYLGGDDAFAIAHPEYRQALAESISRGIARYIAAVPDPRLHTRLTTTRPAIPAATPALPKPTTLVQSGSSPDALRATQAPQP